MIENIYLKQYLEYNHWHMKIGVTTILLIKFIN